MIFAHFLVDVNEANAYIVGCEDTRKALLVDAPAFDPRIPAFLESKGLTLDAIFITHAHYDHTGGLDDFRRAYPGIEVYAGVAHLEGAAVRRVGQDDLISIGAVEARVVATPGHTPEGISLILPGMVFTGDALFAGSIGGTTSPAAAKLQCDHIRRNLFSLPEDTALYSGHGPATTVGIERRYNPFFV